MKKTSFMCMIIALLLVRSASFGQNPYHDAMTISKKLDSKKHFGPKSFPILSKYYPGKTDLEMAIQISANPFLTVYFDPASEASLGEFLTGKVFSSLGNLDVTNLADGFAKFLVKRTKEELSVSFFSKFYDLITREDYKDARILFPQTYLTLRAIGNEIYNYEAYINSLRESFEMDLNGLLDNLPDVIEDGRHRSFFDLHPELKATCLSAIYIGNGLLDKQHPGKIIADYNTSLLDNVDTNTKATIETVQLFSESLRAVETGEYWIDAEQLKDLIEDTVALRIYFGLVYENARIAKIKFRKKDLSSLLAESLLPAIDKITSYNRFIKGFIRQASNVTLSIKNLSGKERDKINFTDYYDFYNDALNLFEYSTQISELPGFKEVISISDKLPDYIFMARTGGTIALDISRRNYSSAIINSYQLLSFSFTENSSTDKFKGFLLKYGTFIAAIAQAENSNEVQDAIEAIALPSGSSRVKRETFFNVSLNAYTGLFLAHESIRGIKDKRIINSYGVTAPIGVAISRGHSIFFLGTGEKGWKENKRGWSSSLFISFIDLGTVAAYRFKDDKTEQVPTIQLKHIFSPGIFISTGLAKLPLSIVLGGQVGPTLRKINNNNTTDISSKTYFRFGISACVDIPLLNFYTQSK